MAMKVVPLCHQDQSLLRFEHMWEISFSILYTILIVNKYLLQHSRCKHTQVNADLEYYTHIRFLQYSVTVPQYHSIPRTMPFEENRHSALKKAQSFEHLRSVPSLFELKPISRVRRFQSCPDLLELDALTNVHPRLQEIITWGKQLFPL